MALPMLAVFVLPFWAMLHQIFSRDGWWAVGEYPRVAVGIIVLALDVWMVAEAVKLWPKIKGVLEPELPPPPRGFPVVEVAGPQNDGGPSG